MEKMSLSEARRFIDNIIEQVRGTTSYFESLEDVIKEVDRINDLIDRVRIFINSVEKMSKIKWEITHVYSYSDKLEEANTELKNDIEIVIKQLTAISSNLDIVFKDKEEKGELDSILEDIAKICRRFEHAVSQMKERYDKRDIFFEIKDEYDVQDMFRVLLAIHTNSITKEDPKGKVTGGSRSSRIDLKLGVEKVIIEIKITNAKNNDDELLQQMAIDKQKYDGDEEQTLVFFVYNRPGPDNKWTLKDPHELERKVGNGKSGNLNVLCHVYPKGW